MQKEIIEHEDIKNKDVQLILRKSNELLSGAKRIIDKAYENKDIGQMKDIHDQAVVLQDLTKRRDMGIDLENELAEIRLYDERKIGELLPDIIEYGGDRKSSSYDGNLKLKDMGITGNQSSRWQSISKIPEPTFNEEINKLKNKKTEITTNHFLKIAKEIDKELERTKNIEQGEKIEIDDNEIDLRYGDFVEVLDDISDDSVDLILTDPPYPVEYIDEWEKLGKFAKKKLKKNGFCIAYCGHKNLFESMKRLNKYLDFYWIFALVHSGNTQIIKFNYIEAGWKPILVYQKGYKKIDKKVKDVIIGTGREKKNHKWQQAIDELNYLIDSFSKPGEIVCDPFAGSGTTLIAVKQNNRIAFGAEKDKNEYNLAKKRISENL